MNYVYEQVNGQLSLNAEIIGVGYAGRGLAKNNPDMQEIHFAGPLPRGWYTLVGPYDHPHLGPLCFNLTSDVTNKMFGRDDFRLHADAIDDPGNASDGCIVMNKTVRTKVASSIKEINRLQVI